MTFCDDSIEYEKRSIKEEKIQRHQIEAKITVRNTWRILKSAVMIDSIIVSGFHLKGYLH